MCGIVGLALSDRCSDAAIEILEGLCQLQHRGQDACGVAVATLQQAGSCMKGDGLLREVFNDSFQPDTLQGHFGIGHVRYRTTGLLGHAEAQPISSHDRHEIYLAHNGQLSFPGTEEMLHPCSDTHFILTNLSNAMQKLDPQHCHQPSLSSKTIQALRYVYGQCNGSFACVAMIDASVILGFRDPFGIKPLILGQRRRQKNCLDYMLASESVALDKLGFEPLRDIRPGEAVLIDTTKELPSLAFSQIVPVQAYSPDIFELFYLARPDSILDGISVQESRQRMGLALADTIIQKLGPNLNDQIDAVIPVPETGYVSALALASRLNVPLALGLVKNTYCHRSFIVPTAEGRLKAVRRKLNTVRREFVGKNVLIVDDSIVRGGTSREIIKMAREAGAKKVIFASSSPAIRFRHIHGIELADCRSLVAYGRNDEEVAGAIDADAVIYLPYDSMLQCCLSARNSSSAVSGFETGVFTGHYVSH